MLAPCETGERGSPPGVLGRPAEAGSPSWEFGDACPPLSCPVRSGFALEDGSARSSLVSLASVWLAIESRIMASRQASLSELRMATLLVTYGGSFVPSIWALSCPSRRRGGGERLD